MSPRFLIKMVLSRTWTVTSFTSLLTPFETKRMQCFTKFISPTRHPFRRTETLALTSSLSKSRSYSTMQEDNKLSEFLDYTEKLKNYERVGVPRGAGTESDDGFDLGRMRRLLQRLGNPQTHFQVVHVAGTKGKGSSAAFLSNILRQGGYSVGCYTSPHLLTIRERISYGKNGDHVSAEALMDLFHQVKEDIDQSIELENGLLTYFEVFTALAFTMFSQEKVDIAIIEAGLGGARDATNVLRSAELAASVITSIGEEHLAALGGSLESIAMAKSGIIKHGRPVVIGGPFEFHIERIIRDKAYSMNSPVVSACDPGISSAIKCFGREDGMAYQTCDILVQVQELELFIDLPSVNIRMLGNHQLQNAVTATCTALCLRKQGFIISDESIRIGLEQTQLLGRSEFLTHKEAETLGVSEASVLVDGAHTEASAKGLSDVIVMTYPDGLLALVVAMASDKDHLGFARQLLTGPRPEIVLLTEVSIAGGKSRATPASTLKDAWMRTAADLGLILVDLGTIDEKTCLQNLIARSKGLLTDNKSVKLAACQSLSICDSVRVADQWLKSRERDKAGLIVVTGSLHIVSSTLAAVTQQSIPVV